ncbi:MAG: type II toxin-antitoxin system VapC family toxin [Bacteroidetes bacterium]|nr:type II toxin-antitoxin system VapC family toxin [Bacteroidota bacterium]
MKQYLLDTNICIFFLKGKFDLADKIEKVREANCFISEITVAELKYGAEKSERPVENRKVVELFIPKFNILPIYSSLDIYAKEKAHLSKVGTIIDEFDLLIGATAVSNGMVMVTNNTSHFSRIRKIKLEDWTKGK